ACVRADGRARARPPPTRCDARGTPPASRSCSHSPVLAPSHARELRASAPRHRRAVALPSARMAARRVIGLTGGISSGKSKGAAMLAELGADGSDTDKVGHEAYRPGTEGFRQVTEAFGQDIVAPDGTIDRRALAAKVFADPAELRRLNAIVHPLIGLAVRDWLACAQAGPR